MLVIKDIHTWYGDSYVLQGVDMEVKDGTVVALLGRNGMGKTTTIRSIIGPHAAAQGQHHVQRQGAGRACRPSGSRARASAWCRRGA